MRPVASAGLLLSGCMLLAVWAGAEPGDAEAKRLVKDAMTQEYLAMDFRGAEAKMKKAAQLCVDKGCGKGIHASVYRYLAVVYAVGLRDQAAAQFAFQNMLDLEPKLKPDPNLSSREVEAAFKAAQRANAEEKEAEKVGMEAERKQKEADARKAGEAKRQVEEEAARQKQEARRKKCEVIRVLTLQEEPWTEQAVGYPVPVFVKIPKLPEGQNVSKVEVDFVAASAGERNTLKLERLKGGWGGYIPCGAIRQEGELSYYVTAYNECGNPLATSGDASEPHSVMLKPAVEGKLPRLPGEIPPEQCAEGSAGAAQAKPARRSLARAQREQPITASKHRVGLFVSPDFAIVSSTAACSGASTGADGAFSCFIGDQDYVNEPQPSAAGSPSTLAPGTLRVSLGYDLRLGDNIQLGGRVGPTLFGRVNEDQSFLPFHLEGRIGYYLGKQPFSRRSIRIGVHLVAGIGQAAGGVSGVPIRDAGGAREVIVWQRGGPVFAGLGLGVELPVSEKGAIALDLGVRQHFAPTLTSFAPTVGYVHGL